MGIILLFTNLYIQCTNLPSSELYLPLPTESTPLTKKWSTRSNLSLPTGNQLRSPRTLFPDYPNNKSLDFWEPSFLNHSASNNPRLTMPYQPPSTQETNGAHTSTPLEIKLNADHAGLSELLRLFPIDSPSTPKETLTSSSPLKIWFLVTPSTKDAMEDTSPWPGDT